MSQIDDLAEPADDTGGDSAPAAVSTAAPARRFRRLRRYGPWIVGALALLIAFLPALLSTAWTRGLILSWLESNVDRPVRFADLDVSWIDGIQLTDLEIHDPDDPERPLLVAPRVHVDAPLLPLLGRRVVVTRCLIEGAEIRVARTATGTSADGAIRRKKAQRRRSGKRPPDGPDEPDDALVLPEISVPVEIRDATLIFRGRSGREARQEGISLTADLTTREGPTTFELTIPGPDGSGLRATGELLLFDADGLLLASDARRIDAQLDIRKFDAQRHDDLVALALGDLEAAGLVDARITASVAGGSSSGSIDLRLLEVGVGDAVEAATRSGREDLTVTAKWETTPGRVRVDALRVRAEGVEVDLDLDAGWDEVRGDGSLLIDLRRVERHVESLGIELPGDLTGRVEGTLSFPGGGATGSADLKLSRLALAARGDGRPDVALGDVHAAVRASPASERFRLDELRIALPGLEITAEGARERDGSVVLGSRLAGRVEDLLATLRTLGLAPARLALQGAIDGSVAAAYAPGDGLLVDVKRLAVTDGETGLRVSGRRDAAGELAIAVEGSGDLARLLRLEAADGRPAAFEGSFDVVASVAGRPGALATRVDRLRVDGNLDLEASGGLEADGTLAGTARVDGTLDDLVLVAQRLGALDGEVRVPGRIEASIEVAGTSARPVVPRLSARIHGGPVRLAAAGSLDADGALQGEATLDAQLQDILDVLHGNAFLDHELRMAGVLAGRLRLEGTRDAIVVPEAVLTCTGGPLDLSLKGSVDAERRVAGSVRLAMGLAELVRTARATGKLARDVELAGRLHVDANVDGTLDGVAIPTAALRLVDGPVEGRVQGTLDASGVLSVQGRLEAGLGAVSSLARAARDLDAAPPIDGSVTARFAANGPRTQPFLQLPELSVRSAGAEIQVNAQRTTEGKLTAHADARGAVADVLAVVRALGVERDWDADGRLVAGLDVEAEGDDLRASLLTRVQALVLRKPQVAGETFREDELLVEIPTLLWDRAAGDPRLVQARVTATGLELNARVEPAAGAAEPGTDLVAKGTLALREEFARSHPKLVAEIELASADVPFELRGDLAGGTEKLASWSGNVTLNGKGARTEHLHIASAAITGVLHQGVLRLDPVDAVVNSGKVTGQISLTLAGEERAHAAVLAGTGLAIDHALAPLLARVLPVFAVGEYGTVGGSVGFDLDVKGHGRKKAGIQRTLEGRGEVRVRDAFVQSESWLEKVLAAIGKSERIDLPEVVAPFRVRDGKVVTDGIPVVSSAFLMRLEGDVDLGGDLDYRVKIKPARENRSFERYARFVDGDGFLPLRLGGRLSDPSVKLPSLKDVLSGDGVKDALKDALDRYRKKKQEEEEEKKQRPPRKRKKKNKKKQDGGGKEER